MATLIQIRRDTLENWTSVNPVLESGEISFVTNQNKFKVGDGVATWTSLPYLQADAFIDSVQLGVDTTGDYVKQIEGTVDHIIVSASGGESASVVLSLPQSISTTSTPTFLGATLGGTQIGVSSSATIDTVSGDLILSSESGAISFEGDTTIDGNLQVEGSFVISGSTELNNKNITLGSIETPTDITADGGGIILKGTTDKNFLWEDTTDSWTSSEHIDLASGKVIKSNGVEVLSSTEYVGNSATSTKLATARTIALSGDLSGSASFDGSASVSINATVLDDSHNHIISNVDGLQTDLDEKAPLASPTFTGTVILPSTTSIGNVSSTEIGYVDGVTSAIQTQINAKAPLASPTFTGTPAAPTAAAATSTTQVATTAFVTTADNLKANIASPTFTGVPAAPTATPDTNTTQLATTAYVIAQGYAKESTASATYAPVANPVFTGTVTLGQDPAQPLQAATKQYVDAVAEGLHIHESVKTATTANIANLSSPGASIDGVTLTTNMRVLVKNQTTTSQNGIYVFNGSSLVRASDFDSPAEIDGGDFVFVNGGTLNDNTGWVQTETVATVGTSPILFTQFSGAGTYTAGTGLFLDGSVFSNTGVLSVNGSTGAITGIATLNSPTFTGTPLSTTAAVDTNTTQIATTAYVVAQSYLKSATAASTYAPLAGPALTGVPTAPTAAPDTNTTQIATTAYVIAQGYAKESSASATYAPTANPTFTGTLTAPTVLLTTADTATAATHYMVETGSDGIVRPKTLANVKNEIVTTAAVNSASATVLGTVTSGTWQGTVINATYIDTGIARLASPTFTGVPSAPTADAATNTTQIATTAYVKSQGYLAGNQTITLSGDATGSGTTAITVVVVDDSHSHSNSTISSLDAGKITTGTLAVARGGTNTTATPTGGGVAHGTGSAIAYTAAGTSGQVLTSNGSSAPTWQNSSGGGGLESASVTVTANDTETTLTTFSTSTYSSAELFVQQKQGTKMTTSKFLVMWDGTDVNITEFAVMDAAAGAANTTITASHSSGTVSITASSSDAETTNVIIKATINYIAA